jgi:hypothetical protein
MNKPVYNMHVRIPKELSRQVVKLAENEYRSMNSMFIILVKEALEQRAKVISGGPIVSP